jgi:hypothetical protein
MKHITTHIIAIAKKEMGAAKAMKVMKFKPPLKNKTLLKLASLI